MNHKAVDIQNITSDWLRDKQVALDILRLDKLHAVVSGNKWFKLKYHLQEAAETGKQTIVTFGGAYSNHIVAVAFASKEAGFQSLGIIRGEKPTLLSETLLNAEKYGMKLQFVSREEYRQKTDLINRFENEKFYWINEGGFSKLGAKGAAEIAKEYDPSNYHYIIAAVGTGTMLAGLITSAKPAQKVIGISAMKGNDALAAEIISLTGEHKASNFELFHDYHFGGFGKHPAALINFINETYLQHQLPLDIVYTGKTFFAIRDLVEKSFFKAGDKLIMIHSGGLQGNSSLPQKVLAF